MTQKKRGKKFISLDKGKKNFFQLIFNNNFTREKFFTLHLKFLQDKQKLFPVSTTLVLFLKTLHEQIICSVLCNIAQTVELFWDTEKWFFFCLLEDSFIFFLCHHFSQVSHPSRTKRQGNRQTFSRENKNALQNIYGQKWQKFFPARKKMMMSCVNTEWEWIKMGTGCDEPSRGDLQMNRELKPHHVSSRILFIQSFCWSLWTNAWKNNGSGDERKSINDFHSFRRQFFQWVNEKKRNRWWKIFWTFKGNDRHTHHCAVWNKFLVMTF